LVFFFGKGCSQTWKRSFPRGSARAGVGEQREMRSPASAAEEKEDHFLFLEAELSSGVLGKYLITQTSFQSPHLVGFSYSLNGLTP